MAATPDTAALLSSSCILNAAYVFLSFILATPAPTLHVVVTPIDQLPVDLRLFDFGWRNQLAGRCLTSLVRTVHAARHVAYHYETWCLRERSNSLADFAWHTFGRTVGVEHIQLMVRDGQRLAWLENECGNGYIGFIMAMDWHRFQATPNVWLLRLAQDLLALPAIRGLLALLPPQWPGESFGHYHEQVLQYAIGSTYDRGYVVQRLSKHCAECALFPPPALVDPRACVGCRRGGFLCRAGPDSTHPDPSTSPAFLSCAIELLRRGDAKCDQLLQREVSADVARPALLAQLAQSTLPAPASHVRPPADSAETAQAFHDDSLPTNGMRLPWGESEHAQQIQLLDLILHLDQKLERVCSYRPTRADEHGAVQAAQCRRSAGARRSLRTLLPRVKEEHHEDDNDDGDNDEGRQHT
ncbi:hypothetical protein LTR70_009409 [Exophiala xenobiotica]|uniref:Uncharacterized protein n=1 Tax=Lithohypha guttulata TaxID=1690604 RepID=A0ABR0JXJ7_9EURO|nr:hypothetical protein LTR24_009312 [Lithohypha guttulata]KAK5310546.1 hypothetical protein LTR70_009409 [Exophiala xenobiotica]